MLALLRQAWLAHVDLCDIVCTSYRVCAEPWIQDTSWRTAGARPQGVELL